ARGASRDGAKPGSSGLPARKAEVADQRSEGSAEYDEPARLYPRGMAKPLRFHAPDRAAWTAWLEQHHASAPEVFLVFYRKAAGKPSIGYAEAVEEALCFGWIDGIKHKLDDRRYSYRFTPRLPGSQS